MTDGIIQEVFKKYYSHMHSFNGYTNFNSIEVITLYDQLLTELVEKIKLICDRQLPASSAKQFKDIMIGDNQE